LFCKVFFADCGCTLLALGAHFLSWAHPVDSEFPLVLFNNTVVKFVLGTTEIPSKVDLIVKVNLV
jgi:hypothetical protein